MTTTVPRRGFTLLEILVAMTILVIAVSSILPLFAVGTTSHKRGMDQTMVSLLAPQICGRLQENLFDPKPKDVKDARIDSRGQTFLYDAAFTSLDRTNSAFVVRVTIKWYEASELRTEPFDTVLLRRVRREKSAS